MQISVELVLEHQLIAYIVKSYVTTCICLVGERLLALGVGVWWSFVMKMCKLILLTLINLYLMINLTFSLKHCVLNVHAHIAELACYIS